MGDVNWAVVCVVVLLIAALYLLWKQDDLTFLNPYLPAGYQDSFGGTPNLVVDQSGKVVLGQVGAF